MLNILYGCFNLNSIKQEDLQSSYESFKHISALSLEKTFSKYGGISVYSKYKPTISFSNEKYLLSAIGDISYPNTKTINALELLELYEKEGNLIGQHLKGHFILSVVDKIHNTCLIVNDVMATFPLFYTLSSDKQLLFSNQLSLLTTIKPFNINAQAIYDYIYFHMIPSPETIYQDIFKLEPGQYLFYKNGQYSVGNYLNATFSEDNSHTEEELANDIFNTLEKSVSYYINNPDTTGCFLSGGLDSSAVAGMLSRQNKNKAKTFSIGFPVPEYNEIDYARIASKTFNTQQYEYFIQPDDVHRIVHEIVASMDEPFGNSSVIPVYYCAKLAKENGVSHLLAGDGGDEIFAGNARYAKQQLFERYFLVPQFFRKNLIEPIIKFSWFNSNPLGHKIKRYVEQAVIPLPDRLETYNYLHITPPNEVFSNNFLTQININAPIDLNRRTYNRPDKSTYLNRMLYLDWKHTLADNDLRKVNTMCELVGIDVSYPMLSNDMIELSCRIPSNLKLTSYKLRYLYKKAMKNFLPDSIINKPKHGFGLPFGIWTKTDKDLQKIAYNAVNMLKNYDIFNNDFLDNAIKNHKNGHASFYGELIWILMILGIWLEQNSKQ